MTLSEICVRRPVFTLMLIFACMTFGVLSFRTLGVDQFPDVEIPVVTVTTTLRRWAVLGWTPFSSTILRVNFSVAVYVLIACVAHALGYYRRAQERESQALALADGLNRAKLDALRLQLQPHFLFNTLNAISALVHRNPNAADELIAGSWSRSSEYRIVGETCRPRVRLPTSPDRNRRRRVPTH